MTQPFIKNGKPVFSGGQPSFGCGGGGDCSAAFCMDLGGGECLEYEEIEGSDIDIDDDGKIGPSYPISSKRCVEWRQCFHYTDRSEPSKGAEIVSWLWEWEDGETSTDQNPTRCTTQTTTGSPGAEWTDPDGDGRWVEDGNNETNDDPVPVLLPGVKLTVTDSAGCVSTASRSLKRNQCEEVLEEIPCSEILDRISSLTATVSGMRQDCIGNTIYLADECNINSCAPDPPWMRPPTGSRDSAFSCADFNGVYEMAKGGDGVPLDAQNFGWISFDVNTCYGGQSNVTIFGIASKVWVTSDGEKCRFDFRVILYKDHRQPYYGPGFNHGGHKIAEWEGSVTLTNPEDIARTPVSLEALVGFDSDGNDLIVGYVLYDCFGWPKNGTCDDPSAGPPVSVPNCTIEVSLI